MHDILPFVIIGVTTGAIYGLAGVGLVLTFKTSGVFNFGHGSVAALAAFTYYFLRDQHHVPWPLAVVLSGIVGAGLVALLLEVLARSLSTATTTIKVVATIGIVLTVLSIGRIWYPGTPPVVEPFLPSKTVQVAGVFVGYDQLIVLGFSVLATGLLYGFFRLSRLGIAMRAVVENADLLARTGESPSRVRRWAWMIGTSFAAVSGIVLAPILGLDALTLTLLVVQAFGAAAIGRFSSLPLTYAGGLVIGIMSSLATKYTATHPSLGGLSASIPFIVLFIVLVCTPRRHLLERARASVRAVQHPWKAPTAARVAGSAAVLAVVLAGPTFAGIHLFAYSSVLTMTMLILSLTLLARTSGQVSLGQLGFAAVGAAAMAHFTTDLHMPWLVAVLLAGLVAMPVGAVVAIPAIRLSGVFLAIATFGFGILLEQLAYPLGFMFTTDQSGIPTPRPGGGLGPWRFGSDKGFYYVLVLFVVAVTLLLQALRTRPLGRILRAMSDSPLAVRTQGASTRMTLVVVFCLSSFVAGVAGALTASLSQFAVGTQFSSFSSLLLFAVVVVVAAGEPWNALVGAAALTLVPAYFAGKDASVYLQLAFGVSAVLYVYVAHRPMVMPHWLRKLLDRPVSTPAPVASGMHAVSPAAPQQIAPLRSGLELDSVVVRFGGVTAVDHVSLVAPLGRLTGLIGPNGAGKSTIFNACSGLIRPASGRVVLGGHDVTGMATPARARMGLGRTFQTPPLFDSLSVYDNVAMGTESFLVGGSPGRQIVGSRSLNRSVRAASEEALELTGITNLRDTQAGILTVGQRRLVELARCVGPPFSVLLLDEPSSGLDARETERFGEVLLGLVRDRGVAILLVEHDMQLVRDVCEHVYVVDFGRLIFEGQAAELVRNEVVRSAYLGGGLPEAG
jgi:ABC-type branched-subunit amino acid transport system ATPase component/branched-subunit amino acid ABC-type transport system permease component